MTWSCCSEFLLKTSFASLVKLSTKSPLLKRLNFGILAMAERYKQKEKPQRQTTETKTIERVRLFYEYHLAEKVLNGFL